MTSVFRGVLEFLGRLGVYDVILPFLLVFSISFAILEKTKIFGTIKIDGVEYTRKNYNSIVAFCLGFFVIASTRLVAIINVGLANVAVIMVAFVSFMIAIGVFFGEGENIFEDSLIKKMRVPIVILTFFSVILIMLNVIKTDAGVSWFDIIYRFIVANWNSNVVGSILLLGLLIGFVGWVSKSPKPAASGDKK